jgi:hypothetical protein
MMSSSADRNHFTHFTQEQLDAIRAIRDDWPDSIDWEEVRQKIEKAGQEYWVERAGRLRLGPPAKVREKLQSVLRQVARLQRTLKELPDDFVRKAPDPHLALLQEQLQTWLETYKYLCGPKFRGRKFLYRDALYASLGYIWIGSMGGEFSFSRNLDNVPYGPLINFYRLVLSAILGKAPGPSRIAKIIELRRAWRRKDLKDFPYLVGI